EAVYKELGDRLVKAATTAFRLEVEQDSGNITKTQSKATPNESSSQGTNLGGGPRCQKTIWDTIAQTRFESISKHSNDSLLARGNTLKNDENRKKLDELMELYTTLQNRVLHLEKTKTTRRNEIDSLKRSIKKLEKRNRSRTHKLKRLYKVGLSDRVESSSNEESLGEDASKHGSGIDADEDITLVNDVDKEMFDMDDLGGEEVFVAGQNKNVVEKIVNAAQVSTAATTVTITTEEITLAQALEALKTSKPKVKWIVFQEPRTELKQEITKKQKVEDDNEKAELKQLMETIPDKEEVAIDAIPLAVKSPMIVDWKIHKEGKKRYYQISDMKTMFKPHVEDEVWKQQQGFKVLEWKLYDSCGVHSLMMQSMQIYMLVEKKYPLTPPTLSMMLEKNLQIDYESEMAYQLFIMVQPQQILSRDLLVPPNKKYDLASANKKIDLTNPSCPSSSKILGNDMRVIAKRSLTTLLGSVPNHYNIMNRINIDDLTIEQYLRLTQENQTPSMVKKVDNMTIAKYIEYEERIKRPYSRNFGSYFPTYFGHCTSNNNPTLEFPRNTYFNPISPNTKFNYDSKDMEFDKEARKECRAVHKNKQIRVAEADLKKYSEAVEDTVNNDRFTNASNNVMPRSIYEYLKLAKLRRAAMSVKMDDMTQQETLGTVKNVLVKINKFEFSCDLLLLTCLKILGK
nr:hypothetical protein [Tanacetum cinerariifolium]